MKITVKPYICFVCLAVLACAGQAAANPGFAAGAGHMDKTMEQREQEVQAELDKRDAAPKISGKVVETMDAGAYTYALLENDGKKTWVAMPEMKVTAGQELVFSGASEMRNFKSKSLGRTFEQIFFCGPPDKKIGGDADGPMAGKASVGSAGIVPVIAEPIKVDKATGKSAYTIEEVYTYKASLDKKPITMKGKVVKVSEGIMGKNWVHVQDGTGDAKKKSNNLVVTTSELPKIGDIIVISGTLSADKDFGGGYRYDVIIEDAVIKQ